MCVLYLCVVLALSFSILNRAVATFLSSLHTHVLCCFACYFSLLDLSVSVFVAVDDEGETNGCAENEVQFLTFPKLCVCSVLVSKFSAFAPHTWRPVKSVSVLKL